MVQHFGDYLPDVPAPEQPCPDPVAPAQSGGPDARQALAALMQEAIGLLEQTDGEASTLEQVQSEVQKAARDLTQYTPGGLRALAGPAMTALMAAGRGSGAGLGDRLGQALAELTAPLLPPADPIADALVEAEELLAGVVHAIDLHLDVALNDAAQVHGRCGDCCDGHLAEHLDRAADLIDRRLAKIDQHLFLLLADCQNRALRFGIGVLPPAFAAPEGLAGPPESVSPSLAAVLEAPAEPPAGQPPAPTQGTELPPAGQGESLLDTLLRALIRALTGAPPGPKSGLGGGVGPAEFPVTTPEPGPAPSENL